MIINSLLALCLFMCFIAKILALGGFSVFFGSLGVLVFVNLVQTLPQILAVSLVQGLYHFLLSGLVSILCIMQAALFWKISFDYARGWLGELRILSKNNLLTLSNFVNVSHRHVFLDQNYLKILAHFDSLNELKENIFELLRSGQELYRFVPACEWMKDAKILNQANLARLVDHSKLNHGRQFIDLLECFKEAGLLTQDYFEVLVDLSNQGGETLEKASGSKGTKIVSDLILRLFDDQKTLNAHNLSLILSKGSGFDSNALYRLLEVLAKVSLLTPENIGLVIAFSKSEHVSFIENLFLQTTRVVAQKKLQDSLSADPDMLGYIFEKISGILTTQNIDRFIKHNNPLQVAIALREIFLEHLNEDSPLIEKDFDEIAAIDEYIIKVDEKRKDLTAELIKNPSKFNLTLSKDESLKESIRSIYKEKLYEVFLEHYQGRDQKKVYDVLFSQVSITPEELDQLKTTLVPVTNALSLNTPITANELNSSISSHHPNEKRL